MKKTGLLVLIMLCLSIPCLAETQRTQLAGGWQALEAPEITDEEQAVFDKAMEGFVGVDYTPLLCLAHQVVAGTNHCYLCQAGVVVPVADVCYALVYVYEDLAGGASILDIEPIEIGVQ